MLELMYQGCDDREGEMKYSELDLKMAGKIEMLADRSVIKENYKNLGKKNSPPIRDFITESVDALQKMMDLENKKNVVEGGSSKSYHDVWLAIDEGL
jgi:hypothetical protein